ncbi:transcriptional regulator [Rheinheimera riviphila]|uniref:Transcriptional regulator n=1 Tax=Rheinheimera riviphila TaxID=1834037 RepID=A0A437QMC6_9GAMM|nr:RNA-binding domain-containing protein [Rheinheimera riviphila]RVU35688.1 transcriptional regulator [Rheinheimera riviphila]
MNSKLPINLIDLLRQRTVEGERIEYKSGWNPDAIIRTICAFANDFENLGGGYVVIGQDCDANGQPVFPPVGLADNQLDKIQQELLAACQLFQPPYFPVLSIEEVEARKLIVLWAPGGQNRPYKAPEAITANKKTWRYYIRRFSSTVEAKGDAELELLSLAAKVPFDDRYNQTALPDDLSKPLLQAFLHEVNSALAENASMLSVEELARQMNVAGGAAEAARAKNVGLLFFNETPERFFPGVQIDVVWFPEGAGGDRFEEKIFKGPLAQMTREALHYIQRNYLRETVIKHPDRAEATRIWNFPYAAIEEALVNAVYHRSYEEREPIEVRISYDELVILSFPGPDRSIRMADLQVGRAVSRRYRNRRIGEFLKELQMTEGRATGIPKILKEMTTNGSPAPKFETDDDRLSFVIRLPRHPLSLGPVITGWEVTGEVTGEVAGEVTGEVERVLRVMSGEMSRQQIQSALGLKGDDHFRTAYLKPALLAQVIVMTLPDIPRSSKQRYRITDIGQQWLATHLSTDNSL